MYYICLLYTSEQRERLKQLIDGVGYSGNTDIGLGLRYAEELIGQEKERKKAIVLISDGESDLQGSETGRSLQNSEMDIDYVLDQCREQNIPIYTIAFGTYDGDVQSLSELSEQSAFGTLNSPCLLYTSMYYENAIIKIESEEGEFTRVTIKIPVNETE